MPGAATRSVTEFGAVGDGKTDDTAAIRKAINDSRDIFFPGGTYLVSDTLHLRPDSRLFGEMYSVVMLKADSPGFQDPAGSKPMLEIPADPTATLTLCHLYFRMLTPGGTFTDWRAGEKSMMVDTDFIVDRPEPQLAQKLMWRISGAGGGFFENAWNPSNVQHGLEITSTGRKWVYSLQQEHTTRTAAIFRKAANLVILVLQFEGTCAPYVRMEDCRNVVIFQTIAGHWGGVPGPLVHVVGGRNVALFNSAICNNDKVITEVPNRWDAGPSYPGSRDFGVQTVWIKR